MRIITVTADDRNALAHDRYHYPDPRVQRKIEVLWLPSHGLTHDQIAASADVSRRTVQRHLDQSHEGSLPRLRRGRWHYPSSALAKHQDSLEEYFLKHPVRSAKEARALFEQQTGVRRGLSQVRHFLKDRLGLRWRQTGAIPVPPKETVQEHAQKQAVFLQEQLEPRLIGRVEYNNASQRSRSHRECTRNSPHRLTSSRSTAPARAGSWAPASGSILHPGNS
jgi:transposase